MIAKNKKMILSFNYFNLKMDFSNLYVVKHNSKVFEPGTIVRGEYHGWSGNLYEVSDLNDSSKSEVLMYYDIYPFVSIGCKFDYEAQWQEVVNAFVAKNQKN
jgi:hypothetical protein